MPVLDAAEPYFGKPGEVIICGFSGARTCPRIDNPISQESPRSVEMRYPSSSAPSQNSSHNSGAGNYQQRSPTPFGAPQQYSEYSNEGTYRQAAATPSHAPSFAPSYASSRQYPAEAPGFYESAPAPRYQ
ncbi:hypothetical protein EG329_011616 [Mollisiaceae sp. DMI_Dod_QoI]|nr:hypothetical protein EG329_011616 [Helotiales sp. DMI_Dod_QoI]